MKSFLFTSLFSLLLIPAISAQNAAPMNCASDVAMSQFYQSHPEKIEEQKQLDALIYNQALTSTKMMTPPYTLPVVVHVIHQNGPENISDEQIATGIEQLNAAFSHSGYYAEQGVGFDTQIQFCLAVQDPDGNPTNGITRHNSPFTNMFLETQDIAMKDIARWNPLDYINIYVVNDVISLSVGAGVLGYAFFPTSHGLPEDGLVCEAGVFGTSPAENSVLIHEMGHYLNLFHTFQGGCFNNDCLADGDQVCDTPPDQSVFTTCVHNSCSTDQDDTTTNNPLTTDENDPTDNYMDYSPYSCYHAFTSGQTDRMYAAIDLVRFSLLESIGCENLCSIPVNIAFTPSSTQIFSGQTVTFTNNSTGATSYQWNIDGEPFASTENSNFTFDTPGIYEVELIINNADVNCQEELTVEIEVNCPVISNFTANSLNLVEGEEFVATNTSENANTYEWFVNGVSVSTSENLNFNFPNEGIYTVLLSASNEGCTAENSVLVNVFATNPCPNPPCAEICDNGIDDDGDGYVDCFDEECECSDGTDCSGEIPPNNFTSELQWRSTDESASSVATPLVANLDPQNGNMPEIIVAEGDDNFINNVTTTMLIFQGDGSNQNAPIELNIQGGISVRSVSTPVIGDIDGNGIPELIVVCGDSRIRVYTNYNPNANPAMELWMTSSDLAVEIQTLPSLADFNGDGIPEILSGNDIFQFDLSNPDDPLLFKALDGTGQMGRLAWYFSPAGGDGTNVSTAVDILSVNDCNGDPDCSGLEIVAGANIYSVDLNPFDGDGLEIKIQRDLNMMSPGFNFIDGYTTAADVNLDGSLDVIVSGTRNYEEMGVYIWDKNGLIGFFPFPLPPPGENENFVGIPSVGNIYDDTVDGYAQNFPEIIVVSAFRLTAFNVNVLASEPDAPYHWSLITGDSSGSTGATLFDFNGDGLDEICYRDVAQMRIMYGGAAPFPPGVNFQRNWTTRPAFSPTFNEACIVADCDADGEAELIYTAKVSTENLFPYTQGHLWVVGSGDTPWVPCRPVWNQYAYFGVNVNDDLTIPANQQTHHLEFPALGSGNRPFNQFMAQMPILDDNFSPFYPVPDAVVNIDEFSCEGSEIRVQMTVCNDGSSNLPADMPILFFNGNPELEDASLISSLFELETSLFPNECQSLEILLPGIYNTPIFVAVNANLSTATPYDLEEDFPMTDIVECDYSNNFASFIQESNPFPAPNLGADIVLCNNSVVVLDPQNSYENYEWQDGTVEPTFTAFGPGIYWVSVQSGCGAPLSDTIEITVNQVEVFDLGPPISLCLGDSVELVTNSFGNITWWPENFLNCTNCNSVIATPMETITYYATGQNGDCVFTDSVQISIAEIDLELSADTINCNNPEAQINTISDVPDLNYTWSGPSGFTFNEANPNVSEAGEYSLIVSGSLGECETTANIFVEIDTLAPLASISDLGSTILCNEEFTTLNASGSSQGDNFTYTWSPSLGISAGINSLTPEINQTGMYLLTVHNNQNGCIATNSIEIDQEETPSILEVFTEMGGCNGEPTGNVEILEVIGGVPAYTFALDNQDLNSEGFFENLTAGSYILSVFDANNCQSDTLIEIMQPEPIFVDLFAPEAVPADQIFQVEATVNPPESVLTEIIWQTDSISNDLTYESVINENTIFTITVVDDSGCIATNELLVNLIPPPNSIYFPNVINRNSINDANVGFTGFGDERVSLIRTLQVYDRWGGLVYEGTDLQPNSPNKGWDGSVDGEPANQGLYVYFAQVEFSDGDIQMVSGGVTVVE